MVIESRKATEADTAFARETHHAAYHDVVVAQFSQWDAGAQDRFFENDWSNAEFDILLCDGEPCGYAAVEDRPDDVHVRELVIHPGFQNRGIGTAFLRGVMDRAAARGVPVRLGIFRLNRALRLYERLGFRVIDQTASHVILEWADSQ